jgi:hypothetical protein
MQDMLKALTGLLPLAVGLVAFAIMEWILLSRNLALGKWLLAAFLVGHGLVFALFFVPQRATETTPSAVDWPFDMGRSWLITGPGLDAGLIQGMGRALVIVVVAGFALAGLATVGLLVPTTWWQGLVVGSSVASIVLMLLFLSPGLLLGFAIDAVLLWVVFALPWAPSATVA